MQKLTRAWLTGLLCVAVSGCTTRLSERYEQEWLNQARPNSVLFASRRASDEQTDLGRRFPAPVETRLAGKLASAEIDELSGLAPSLTHSGIFYAINDSGNAAVLYAITADGQSVTQWKLPVKNLDWEDIATFRQHQRNFLMIADVGDNLRARNQYQLHIFEEPARLSDSSPTFVRTLTFRYETGAENVESMAVSVAENAVYLVAKTSRRPALYHLPLNGEAGAPLLARRVAMIRSLPKTSADGRLEMLLASRLLLSPTAMDISADDRYAVLANYRHIYLYAREQAQSWPQALAGVPRVISSHRLKQSESVAFSKDGQSVLFGSEGRHAALLILGQSTLPEPLSDVGARLVHE